MVEVPDVGNAAYTYTSLWHGLQLAPPSLQAYYAEGARRIDDLAMVPELTEVAKAALVALLIRRNADPEGGTYMVQADAVFQPFEVLAPLASLDPD